MIAIMVSVRTVGMFSSLMGVLMTSAMMALCRKGAIFAVLRFPMVRVFRRAAGFEKKQGEKCAGELLNSRRSSERSVQESC